MKFRFALAALFLLSVSVPVYGEDAALVADSESTVALKRSGSALLLHAEQAARAFGWEAKLEQGGQLLVICREGGVCVPLPLANLKTDRTGGELFVEAGALAKALQIRVVDDGNAVTLAPREAQADNEDDGLPDYNAAWGEGRGLRVGQTLPDIPLYDLDGNEVRFSKFLGKQYVIYCWASW